MSPVSMVKKTVAVVAAFSTAFASTFGSSIAVGAQDTITSQFHVPNTQGTLLVSLYLIGSSLGPLLYAPLSEIFGRRYPLGVGVTLMLVFTAASAIAPNWHALLAFRFLAGLGASAPMSISGGIIADLFMDHVIRGYIISCLMATTTLGSLLSSLISLKIMSHRKESWSLCFWINTAVVGLSWLAMFLMPETRTAELASGMGRLHLPPTSIHSLFLPLRMTLFEPILLSSCLFLSLEYSIFYIFFQLLPLVFAELQPDSNDQAVYQP